MNFNKYEIWHTWNWGSRKRGGNNNRQDLEFFDKFGAKKKSNSIQNYVDNVLSNNIIKSQVTMKNEHSILKIEKMHYIQNQSNMNCVYCSIIKLEYRGTWNNIFNAKNKSKYHVQNKHNIHKKIWRTKKKLTTKGINQSIRLLTVFKWRVTKEQ